MFLPRQPIRIVTVIMVPATILWKHTERRPTSPLWAVRNMYTHLTNVFSCLPTWRRDSNITMTGWKIICGDTTAIRTRRSRFTVLFYRTNGKTNTGEFWLAGVWISTIWWMMLFSARVPTCVSILRIISICVWAILPASAPHRHLTKICISKM